MKGAARAGSSHAPGAESRNRAQSLFDRIR
jgi:hypothetical protein